MQLVSKSVLNFPSHSKTFHFPPSKTTEGQPRVTRVFTESTKGIPNLATEGQPLIFSAKESFV